LPRSGRRWMGLDETYAQKSFQEMAFTNEGGKLRAN